MIFWFVYDRLCGLVVRVPGYRFRGPGFDFRRYQIFWEVVGLERGSLSLVTITEERLEWKSSGSGLENRYYGRGDPLRWPRENLYPQKLALTSPTSVGRSVDIVRLRTKATEFSVFSLVNMPMLLEHSSRENEDIHRNLITINEYHSRDSNRLPPEKSLKRRNYSNLQGM
jgi:hypothetical protein